MSAFYIILTTALYFLLLFAVSRKAGGAGGQRYVFPGQQTVALVGRGVRHDRSFVVGREFRVGTGNGTGRGYDLHADVCRFLLGIS